MYVSHATPSPLCVASHPTVRACVLRVRCVRTKVSASSLCGRSILSSNVRWQHDGPTIASNVRWNQIHRTRALGSDCELRLPIPGVVCAQRPCVLYISTSIAVGVCERAGLGGRGTGLACVMHVRSAMASQTDLFVAETDGDDEDRGRFILRRKRGCGHSRGAPPAGAHSATATVALGVDLDLP